MHTITMSNGDILTLETDVDLSKFILFSMPKYEAMGVKVLGTTPRIKQLGGDVSRLLQVAARIRNNKIQKEIDNLGE